MKRLVLIFFLLFASTDVLAVRVKDLVEIQGVRENRLAGYGLVVGLNGTGDKAGSQFTIRSL
ncbi:MAG TPA: flagellar basal body P-ring protein FlgI, partial [Deltaproteobacteria bacterium]|nr:flagellar basal body P-ring protein FlgI [Deltaproteobacteria bacterium]